MSHRRLLGVSALLTALATVLTVAPASAAPSAKKPSDAAIAKQGVLRLSDFPAGWQQKKHKDSKPSGIAACKGTEAVVARNKRYRAQSPDFSQGDLASAENSVYVFPREAQAIAFLKPYQAAVAATCLQKGTEKALKKASPTVQVVPLDVRSAIPGADDGVGYLVKVTVPGQTQPTQLFLAAVAVRIGRSVTGFTTADQGQPLNETDSLISASLNRLGEALG